MRLVFAAVVAGLLMPSIAHAETVSVAVAANFTKVAEQLAPLFKTETGHDVSYSFGATGQLYTQISQGAPFQVFLAADDQRPAKAVEEDLGVKGSVFTYAVGALALYGGTTDVSDGEAVLAAGAFDKIAIADPATAPYGAAAMETLDKLGLTSQIEPKLVTGENITQTLQFIESGNAELGFVAASQVVGKSGIWIVPESYHAPIRQDAVLLTTGQDSEAAKAFVDFLQGETAREVIESAGYKVD
jgi:molybdate transport system substrate-binding protein